MNTPEQANRELEALRERMDALSTAILRTNSSLDLATVLQEAVDTARALTAARYGIITTVDEAGEEREFVTSGFIPEEKRQFAERFAENLLEVLTCRFADGSVSCRC